eukprot:CAMPEP_0175897852 /NCGR_PEP_ID=MMETSP0108-20121206/943_1 /TAXON_ID=195067 ORGANISM="Goniomonas pacifica, Strain CCMP1869" /NCGR_SAMPLE_ID=MMETSP0108 /ASSEMBLY_ACC=CAM_ASM_000204 /LENGTH=147 /DNA_ID=CAMNT_0017219183 /DNA_START=49 /DNA_END=493 /DNA_ORIENTATION=+
MAPTPSNREMASSIIATAQPEGVVEVRLILKVVFVGGVGDQALSKHSSAELHADFREATSPLVQNQDTASVPEKLGGSTWLPFVRSLSSRPSAANMSRRVLTRLILSLGSRISISKPLPVTGRLRNMLPNIPEICGSPLFHFQMQKQ